MANEAIVKAVEDMIQKGRISADLKNEYIQHFEQTLGSDLLRGADYTNKTKQLAEDRRQAEQRLQQEYQKLNSERARLEQWQSQVQTELGKLDALPEMTAKLAAYEQILKDYQIYDQVSVPPVPKTSPNQAQPNRQPEQRQDGQYMTVSTAGAALRDFALLQGKVSRVQAQHMKLFGEPLDDDLISHYLDTGEDPEQHWRVKYNVDAKRQQISETNRQAEMARIKEEARAELMQELALDPSRVVGSPLGRPQGGLTPLLEQYSQSRATSHSQNALGGTPPPPGADNFIPPEKKPELAAARERIAAASKMFNEHFDVLGNPATDQGRKLAQKYGTS